MFRQDFESYQKRATELQDHLMNLLEERNNLAQDFMVRETSFCAEFGWHIEWRRRTWEISDMTSILFTVGASTGLQTIHRDRERTRSVATRDGNARLPSKQNITMFVFKLVLLVDWS